MSDTDIEIGFYTKRERKEDELFPWDFIDAGVSRKYLLDEWRKAMRAEITPNCHVKCNVCGAAKFRGGVCFNEAEGSLETRAGTEVPYIYPVEDCNPVPGIHTPASS